MCERTTMYGFNAFLDKRKQRYHYFDDREVRQGEGWGGCQCLSLLKRNGTDKLTRRSCYFGGDGRG
jgi:hypothetical protein